MMLEFPDGRRAGPYRVESIEYRPNGNLDLACVAPDVDLDQLRRWLDPKEQA